MARNDLTAQRLRELFEYNPETGLFRCLYKRKKGRALKEYSPNYRVMRVDGVTHTAHRLAWLYVNGRWPEDNIDHIDGNRLNNRMQNLRDVTSAVNTQNVKRAPISNKSCGLLGVTKDKKKWSASIATNGKRILLGTFETAEIAHQAYLEAKRQMHQGCTI